MRASSEFNLENFKAFSLSDGSPNVRRIFFTLLQKMVFVPLIVDFSNEMQLPPSERILSEVLAYQPRYWKFSSSIPLLTYGALPYGKTEALLAFPFLNSVVTGRFTLSCNKRGKCSIVSLQ